jgi:stress-induced morphogen
MSTKVKDSLHELIHSLSKSEKRYYKIYASRHMAGEDSTMITLFDYISRQSAYDEETLFIHFKGKAFLNQFSTVKKRLYDQILQSLHAFHANNSMENQVNRMLHQANLLYEKSLYDQCFRHLRSAEKLAVKHDLFPARLAINKLKNRIIETRGYRTDEESIEQLKLSTEKSLSQERLILDLWHIKSKLFQLLQLSGTAQSSQDHARIDQLMASIPAEELRTAFASTESTYLYYHIHAAYHFAKHQLKESLYYTEQTIEHLSASDTYINERPNTLISALTNACYLAENIGEYDKSLHFLNTLKQFAKIQETNASEDLQIKLFSSRYSIELNLLILKGHFQEAQQLSAGVLTGLDHFREKITSTRKAFLLLQLAVTAIGCEQPAKALQHINTILNDPQLDDNESIMGGAHLLNLVVHFELKNFDHLQYVAKNTQRLLKSTRRLHAFEQAFIQQIVKLTKAHALDFEELFSELFAQLSKDTTSKNLQAKHNFDYLTWIGSKATNQSFAQKMKDNYRTMTSVG